LEAKASKDLDRVVEDLFAEDFGEPLAELGVLVAESFVVCAEVGGVGQQRRRLVRVFSCSGVLHARVDGSSGLSPDE
jgi:hypothetical protein